MAFKNSKKKIFVRPVQVYVNSVLDFAVKLNWANSSQIQGKEKFNSQSRIVELIQCSFFANSFNASVKIVNFVVFLLPRLLQLTSALN